MICPKCGNKMARTEKSPNVFMPDKVPDALDSLQVAKMWVCDSNHSDYSYYLFMDKNSFQVSGLGSDDLTVDIASFGSVASGSNTVGRSVSELIPLVSA